MKFHTIKECLLTFRCTKFHAKILRIDWAIPKSNGWLSKTSSAGGKCLNFATQQYYISEPIELRFFADCLSWRLSLAECKNYNFLFIYRDSMVELFILCNFSFKIIIFALVVLVHALQRLESVLWLLFKHWAVFRMTYMHAFAKYSQLFGRPSVFGRQSVCLVFFQHLQSYFAYIFYLYCSMA